MILQIGHNNPNILQKIFSGYHDVQAHCLYMHVCIKWVHGQKMLYGILYIIILKTLHGCKSLLLHTGSSQPQEI